MPLQNLCQCCRKSPRFDRHIYGIGCKRGLNNVTNAAKKKINDPKLKDWPVIRKAGGAPLNSLIMSYRQQNDTSTSSQGKHRNTFDVCAEMEDLVVAQSVETGVRLVYMHYERWLRVAQTDHLTTVIEADADWEKTKASLPASKHKTRNGHLFLPMPAEDYIDGKNTVAHENRMRLSGKAQKNPDGLQLDQAKQRLQCGALGLGNAAFQNVGGAELQIASDLEESFVLSPEKMLGVPTATGSAPAAPSHASAQSGNAGHGGVEANAGNEEQGQGNKNLRKRKRFDVAAAQNRTRSAFLDNVNKLLRAMKVAFAEGQKTLGEHEGAEEYAGYVLTLKQRLMLTNLLLCDVPVMQLRKSSTADAALNLFPMDLINALPSHQKQRVTSCHTNFFHYREAIDAKDYLSEERQHFFNFPEHAEQLTKTFGVDLSDLNPERITDGCRLQVCKLHRKTVLQIATGHVLEDMDSCPVEEAEAESLLL